MGVIYIDSRPYEVEENQNLLQACLALGFDIPFFCWHPALHSVGACRQCAVKVFHDEKDLEGHIVMSCMTPATDGTRLSIDDPEARAFRSRNIEWLMLNHPHDCPVCDEGGECHLQDMTVLTGHTYRRTRFPKRTHVNQELGPFVYHEMNRCIQCYRCVRFYHDYAGGRDLNVFGSHGNVYFGRHEDGTLESEFSGNLVEICPTGVFTDKTFRRHYTRKWDLQTAPTLCVHCGLGCNIIAGERYGMLRRVLNRYHDEVNRHFLCDRGRYGYEFVNAADRIRKARSLAVPSGSGNEMTAVIASAASSGRIVGIGSPRASLEANFALRQLVGADNFYSGLSARDHALTALALKIISESPAQIASVSDVEKADACLILGEDVVNTAPRLALALQSTARQKPTQTAAGLHIPPWDDGARREAIQDERGPFFIAASSATNLDPLASLIRRGSPAETAQLGYAVAHTISPVAPSPENVPAEIRAAATDIARGLLDAKRPVVISGVSLGEENVIKAAANIASALHTAGREPLFHLALPECNSMGTALLQGKPLEDLAEGEEPSVLIILENDLFRRLPPAAASAIMERAGHAVAIDHSETPTTARARTVLPAASFAETSGTLISSEGRAQRFFPVMPKHGAVTDSWRWIEGIAETLGQKLTWTNLDE
ncbi:MAG: NADH-quinone oxidoreductase subunit NuoG, partial [Smithellaceae bacterium]|nr:NADH-quinone oxidoreductase subunit NuoG [Smithellaceae bacterium]